MCVLPEDRAKVKEITAALRDDLNTATTKYQIRPTYFAVNFPNELFPNKIGASVLIFRVINPTDRLKKIYYTRAEDDGFVPEDITQKFHELFGYNNENFDSATKWISFGPIVENETGLTPSVSHSMEQNMEQNVDQSQSTNYRGQARGRGSRGNFRGGNPRGGTRGGGNFSGRGHARGRGASRGQDKSQPSADSFVIRRKDAISRIPRF